MEGAHRKSIIEKLHHGMDPWLYATSTNTNTFSRAIAVAQKGQRTVHKITVAGVTAYRKWDARGRGRCYMDGARDKIASDLGQLLGANVPATLLWSHRGDSGCVQKEPPNFFGQSLQLFRQAIEADPEGGEAMLAKLARSYDPMSMFLDIWTGNTDRFENEGNTLLCENSNSCLVWIIDFNCSLGHKERPWSEFYGSNHGFDAERPPVPYVIAKRPEWRERIAVELDKLQNRVESVDAKVIDEICERSFDFYRSLGCRETTSHIAELLKKRQVMIKGWAVDLL